MSYSFCFALKSQDCNSLSLTSQCRQKGLPLLLSFGSCQVPVSHNFSTLCREMSANVELLWQEDVIFSNTGSFFSMLAHWVPCTHISREVNKWMMLLGISRLQPDLFPHNWDGMGMRARHSWLIMQFWDQISVWLKLDSSVGLSICICLNMGNKLNLSVLICSNCAMDDLNYFALYSSREPWPFAWPIALLVGCCCSLS